MSTLSRLNKQSNKDIRGEHAGTKHFSDRLCCSIPERYPETVLAGTADMLIPAVPFSGPLSVHGYIDFDFVFDVNDGVNSVSRAVP